MRYHSRSHSLALAAIPYLLLSASQQAGIITHVSPDGSGERLVYARTAPSRAGEMHRHLQATLPLGDWSRTVNEGSSTLAWRDGQVANLAKVGGIEVANLGIAQSPLSIYTTHTWKETLSFDRGDATDIEVHGQGLAKLKYIVQMPGAVTSQSPAGKAEGGKVEWDVTVGPQPQVFAAESRTLRWPYLALWLWVLAFVVSKAIVYAPRVARRIPRKPAKI